MEEDLLARRIFDAPALLVWKAWAESTIIKQWWGPGGSRSAAAMADFREGGTALVCIKAGAGNEPVDVYLTWIYKKIITGVLIGFNQQLSGNEGRMIVHGLPQEAAALGNEVQTNVFFNSLGAVTTMVSITAAAAPDSQMTEFSRIAMEQQLSHMSDLFTLPAYQDTRQESPRNTGPGR